MKMGYGNPPKITAPLERQDELAHTIKTNEANDGVWTTHVANSSVADHTPFSFTPLVYAPFPWGDINEPSPSYPFEYENTNSRLGGNTGFNLLPDPKTDPILNFAKIKVPEFPRESYASYPDVNIRGHVHEIDGNNTDFLSKNYHESEVQTNPMSVRGYAIEDYPIKAYGAEAKNSSLSRSHQLRRNFSPSGFSTSIPSPANHCPGKVDGSFLTLGIGGGTEIRRNSNFSTREIASKLEEAASAQPDNSHAKRKSNNLLSFAGTSSNASMIQTSAGGFPSLANNAQQDLFTIHSLWTPQTDEQTKILATNDPLRFDYVPSSMPFVNSSVSYPERINSSLLGYEPVNPAYFASQSNFNQQRNLYGQHGKSSSDVLAEPSRNLLYDRPIVYPSLGNLTPLTEATRIGSVPRSVQPVGHQYPRHNNTGSVEAHGTSLFPERFSFPVPKGNAHQSSIAGPFPKRLGVQPNDFAFPQSAQLGPPPIPLAPQVNPFPPFPVAGPHKQFIPTPLPTVPRVDFSNGQVNRKLNLGPPPQPSPNPKVYNNQSLKRPATESPAFATSSQRRRITPQPLPPSQSNPPPQSQSVRPTIPAAPHHIKWQGFSETLPPPSGQKCLLCKRDLCFTAEGQVYQPTNPPSVAVLPCGHTFHDHCLQLIVPPDQSKNPPCIPCAIGEA